MVKKIKNSKLNIYLPELGLELPVQSIQSIAAWFGSQDGGGKISIDILDVGWIVLDVCNVDCFQLQ